MYTYTFRNCRTSNNQTHRYTCSYTNISVKLNFEFRRLFKHWFESGAFESGAFAYFESLLQYQLVLQYIVYVYSVHEHIHVCSIYCTIQVYMSWTSCCSWEVLLIYIYVHIYLGISRRESFSSYRANILLPEGVSPCNTVVKLTYASEENCS